MEPKRHILLRIAYKGGAYHGYQVQENAKTVAEALEKALVSVIDHPVKLQASSRTDAGVHALDLPVAFSTPKDISTRGIVLGINRHLPSDIRVVEAQAFSAPISPRRQSRGKVYRYHVWNAQINSPLLSEYTWQLPAALNLDLARQALTEICGQHDFSAFQASGCSAEHALRRITRATLTRNPRSPKLITLEIHGEAFVRHQVRILSGTIMEICMGRRAPDCMAALLKPALREDAGRTAPAQGLLLARVDVDLPSPLDRWPHEPIDSTELFPVLCG